jgi:DNA-binding NtrC family response regulator
MVARILVIDDDQAVSGMLQRMLQREGFTVITAANGVEVLSSDLIDRVDLVISDVQMPEMNGIELLQKIRERSPHLPVLVTTGAWPGFLEDAALFGANRVLQKPIERDTLLASVRALLDPALLPRKTK